MSSSRKLYSQFGTGRSIGNNACKRSFAIVINNVFNNQGCFSAIRSRSDIARNRYSYSVNSQDGIVRHYSNIACHIVMKTQRSMSFVIACSRKINVGAKRGFVNINRCTRIYIKRETFKRFSTSIDFIAVGSS